jgi:hypothetical protein
VSPPVKPHESLTRFIFSHRHYNASTGKVNTGAVGPRLNLATGVFEWSVYRTTDLSPADLWQICADYVDSTNNVAEARSTFISTVVGSLELSCDPDGEPHSHHVNITNWPAEESLRLQARQKMAAAMSGKEKLELRPIAAQV